MRNFQIVIDEYTDKKIYDVLLTYGNKILESKQGLKFFAAGDQIINFTIRYALEKTDLIVNNVYDIGGHLSYSEQITLDEYMKTCVQQQR